MGIILFNPPTDFKPMMDYPKGSLLILGKYTHLKGMDGYCYLINYWILDEGSRNEYLKKIMDNPKYDLYYIRSKDFNEEEIGEIVRQIEKLEKDGESEDFIYKAKMV